MCPKFDARMNGDVCFNRLAIPLHRHIRDGNIFKEEQIVMPESIDCMLNILSVLHRHDEPSLAELHEAEQYNNKPLKCYRDRQSLSNSVSVASV